MHARVVIETFPIRGRFSISRGARTEAEVVRVELAAEGFTGHGECVPYLRYGETAKGVAEQIEAVMAAHPISLERRVLEEIMPAGAARNALDCALIDLEAQVLGVSAAQLLGLPQKAAALTTAFTISLDSPQAMARAAQNAASFPILKLKLGGEGDAERLAAIRGVVPRARLIVDANEAWSAAALHRLLACCDLYGVELVEQPLAGNADAVLTRGRQAISLCADESIHDLASLDGVAERYDAINVKLDKTGGLTHALALIAAARARDLKIMVGCMLGTSLGVAPALLAARLADWVDLDGPLLLASDRTPSVIYEKGLLVDDAPGCGGTGVRRWTGRWNRAHLEAMSQSQAIPLESCAAIVLAAGLSRRFGADNKLLAILNGRPVIAHVLQQVSGLGLGQRLLVVGGPDAERLAGIAAAYDVEIVTNPHPASGMGASIACGAGNIAPSMEGVFIVLGDMPLLPPEIFPALASRLSAAATVARPLTPQGPGHPVLFSRRHFDELRTLSGDTGAGKIVAAAGPALALVQTDHPGCVTDIDTQAALGAIQM